MEHLPPVSQPYDPVLVPYDGFYQYDNLDFAGYPSRKGWDVDRLLKCDFQGHSLDATAAFLQTWLYFGLMHEVMDLEIKSEDFVRVDESGNQWLTTQKLPDLLQQFREQVERERISDNKLSIFQLRNSRIDNCFSLSRTIFLAISFDEASPLSPEVSFAIHVLAITLQVGATEICGLGRSLIYPNEVANQPGYRAVPWESGRHWRITPNSFTERRMIAQGWCPTIVGQVQSQYNILGQYYVSLFGPPKRRLDHRNCDKLGRDCEGFKDLAGPHSTHIADNCHCGVLSVDALRLETIIREGDIPLLCYNEEEGHLEVVSLLSHPEIEYTAISHVWTDGWGNPNENSLATCRVKQLVHWISESFKMPDFFVTKSEGDYQSLSDFHHQTSKGIWQTSSIFSYQDSDGTWQQPERRGHVGKLYFWMDTLCVPRHPDEIHDRAITQMRDVYTNAERVLVLDAELLDSTADASYEEVNMRLQCSRWIRRLWTLQEAVLTKRLIFQFADRALLLSTGSHIWEERQIDLRQNYYNSIGWDCHTSFSFYLYLTSPHERLPYIWRELLCNRSVSYPADEPVCGSILMDFDLNYLMTAPEGPERMRRFWEMHAESLPVPVLFVPGPRLDIKGYRWAPSSLLPCEKAGPAINHLGSINRSTPLSGLTILFRAYTTFLVDSPREAVTLDFPCMLDGRPYFIRKAMGPTNASLEDLQLQTRRQLAVIIELPATQKEDGTWGFEGTRAALVEIGEKGNKTWTAEYLRLVTVIRKESLYHQYPSQPFPALELEEMEKEPVEAKWVSMDQEWCLT